MPKIHATDRDGTEKVIDADDGVSMMIGLRDNGGLDIASICGGMCSCATCHVYVDEAWVNKLKEKGEEEIDMLDLAFDVEANCRLSCQLTMKPEYDGLKVTLAPE